LRTLGFLLAIVSLLACSKKKATESDGGMDAPVSAAFASVSIVSPSNAIVPAKVEPIEALRSRVTRFADEPALDGATELLERHFAGARSSYDVQTTPLTAAGRRIVLISESDKPTSDARPFAFVAAGPNVLWSKERPVAGIMPPVGPIAIAPAPAGRVALAACDPPTSILALRIWDDDGSPFADFQALAIEDCKALSLLYWPRHGWIVVDAYVGATRAQMLDENGGQKWRQGIDVGVRSRASALAPASLAADTDDSFVLVQVAAPSGADNGPLHALAFRYDARGNPLWPAPIDLGDVGRAAGARVQLVPANPGVRVTLPNGRALDLRPTGEIARR
jgi:hypothetical protein